MLLCFAIQSVQIAVEWLCKGFPLLRLLLSFGAESCNRSVVACSGCMKVGNGALAADFSAFWR